MPKQNLIATLLLSFCLHANAARATDLEVLHWWTSGSEAEALAELKKMLKNKTDYQWKDFSVVGGGGQNALKVLKSRVLAGKTPAAVQLKGPAIQEWGKYLTRMDSIAREEKWTTMIPASVAGVMQVDGHWTAVPVNVHRVNWVWMHAGLFKKLGGAMPQSIDELFALAEKAQKQGIPPFAHGGEPWQDMTAFEEILLASQGPEFFQQFASLKPEALQSDKLKQTFDWMRRYSDLLPKNRKGMSWDKASKEVIEGRALMQFMGDWAKGEITIAGKTPGTDVLCLAVPGSDRSFIYNVDSFAFFDTQSDVTKKGQLKLASLILSREFQELFNKKKGSIPARVDLDMKSFDSCAQASMETFRNGTLVPSVAHHMALPPKQVTAIQDLVSEHLNSRMTSEEAVRKLKAAIDANK
jgi:glucose/mannose transport system substrate-binding protein